MLTSKITVCCRCRTVSYNLIPFVDTDTVMITI
jgi:hypothetical protein